MKTVCIIPARGGSKGVPRKNILHLCGKPLLAWVVEAAVAAKLVEEVYVSTNDKEIADVATQYGAEIIWRPNHLSGDTATSESALLHGLDFLKSSNPHAAPETLLFLQCTSPLTSSQDIDDTIAQMYAQNADTIFSAVDFHHFLWKQGERGAQAINHDKSFRPRRQDMEPQYLENGAIYAMRVSGFLEAKHRFFGKTVLYAMPKQRCWEIDDETDFEIAEILIRNSLAKNNPEFLDVDC